MAKQKSGLFGFWDIYHFTIHARNLYLAVLPVWASNWSCLSIPMATQRWSVQHFAAAAAVVVIGTVGSLCFVFVATSVPAETDLKSQRKKKVEEYVVTLKKKGFKGADEVLVLAYVDPLWLIFFCSTENSSLFFNFNSFKMWGEMPSKYTKILSRTFKKKKWYAGSKVYDNVK